MWDGDISAKFERRLTIWNLFVKLVFKKREKIPALELMNELVFKKREKKYRPLSS